MFRRQPVKINRQRQITEESKKENLKREIKRSEKNTGREGRRNEGHNRRKMSWVQVLIIAKITLKSRHFPHFCVLTEVNYSGKEIGLDISLIIMPHNLYNSLNTFFHACAI
jgi:hypothetical protein